MLALCGILKVNEFRMQTFGVHVIKFEENVDLTEKLMDYLDGLNAYTKAMIEGDIKAYAKLGPIDAIEITIDSGESRYVTINKVIYERLSRYIQADRRVVRIKFKFYNRMQRCTYVDKEASGDYLLIPVACKTDDEEVAAVAWCRETIKSIIQGMYEKYGNNLSANEALEMLGVDPLIEEQENKSEDKPSIVKEEKPAVEHDANKHQVEQKKYEVVTESSVKTDESQEDVKDINIEEENEEMSTNGVVSLNEGLAEIDAYLKEADKSEEKIAAMEGAKDTMMSKMVDSYTSAAQEAVKEAVSEPVAAVKAENVGVLVTEDTINTDAGVQEAATDTVSETSSTAEAQSDATSTSAIEDTKGQEPAATVVEEQNNQHESDDISTQQTEPSTVEESDVENKEPVDLLDEYPEELRHTAESDVVPPKPIGFGFDDDDDEMANAMSGM